MPAIELTAFVCFGLFACSQLVIAGVLGLCFLRQREQKKQHVEESAWDNTYAAS